MNNVKNYENIFCTTSLSGHLFKSIIIVFLAHVIQLKKKRDYQQLLESKAIPITGHGGLSCCEMLRISTLSRQEAHRLR
jgi:hypothetical protein